MVQRALRVDTQAALAEEAAVVLGTARHGAALCLSGGGVRSAAFSLGVLQGLARAGLLGEFHYLSTVSGGGYTGAWLAATMASASEQGAIDGGFASATAALCEPADPRLVALREFTNFLTPTPGPTSADTRAGVVLWLRNVLLNWLVFGPAMLAVAAAPVFYAALLGMRVLAWPALFLGLAALFMASFAGCRDLPAHAYRDSARAGQRAGVPTATVRRRIVLPALAWAMLAPLGFVAVARPVGLGAVMPVLATPWWRHGDLWLSGGAFLALLAGYAAAACGLPRRDRGGLLVNAPWWIIASAAAASLLQLGLWLGHSLPLAILAVLGPLWVIVAHVLQTTLYVGLRTATLYADLDREWLARLNADKLAPALAWAALAATVLLVSRLPTLPDLPGHLVAFASGPVGAWLASSSKSLFGRRTPGPGGLAGVPPILIEIVVGLATLLFAAVLFATLGRLAAAVAGAIEGDAGWFDAAPLASLMVIVVCGMLAWSLGYRIDVNRFSMNGVYRNRLIRAFLGTARPCSARSPDDYTGFDPRDNLRLATLYPVAGRPLFPVINVTLNLIETKRTAWSERKAASFPITPLRAGADCLSLAPRVPGVFVRTDSYGGGVAERGADDRESGAGMTLGGAMALSGAAVSPAMGYHSSPATSFLMTLFDVRLGAWLPNPAKTDDAARLNQGRPSNALSALAAEMFGLANDRRDNVYLSDGGHFDNLGLYEMLRRRCRRIVVVDAGCDPEYTYADLGDSVRRAAIDFDATIEFAPAVLSRETALPQFGAYARIAYARRPGEIEPAIGELLYVKPYLPPDMPADVMAYASAHGSFPHETTADQFFTESQFESYRHLGAFIAGQAIGGATSLADWLALAREQEIAAVLK